MRVQAQLFHSCLTLCDPMGCSPVREIFWQKWDFPGKNTGVGCHALLQGIFLTQGLNLHLLHCRKILYNWALREFPGVSFKRALILFMWAPPPWPNHLPLPNTITLRVRISTYRFGGGVTNIHFITDGKEEILLGLLNRQSIILLPSPRVWSSWV